MVKAVADDNIQQAKGTNSYCIYLNTTKERLSRIPCEIKHFFLSWAYPEIGFLKSNGT